MTRIVDLPPGVATTDESEILAADQAGGTVKMTVAQLLAKRQSANPALDALTMDLAVGYLFRHSDGTITYEPGTGGGGSYDPAGTAATLVAAHNADGAAHPGLFAPSSHVGANGAAHALADATHPGFMPAFGGSDATKYMNQAGGWSVPAGGGGGGSVAAWGKITNPTPISVVTGGVPTLNRLHEISGTTTDFVIDLSSLTPAVGDVLGFYVKGWAQANKQYDVATAGAGVRIADRPGSILLIHGNVMLIEWNGTEWVALVLCLDTPWIETAMSLHAATTDPTFGAGTTATMRWRRVGSEMQMVGNISQPTSAGTAGTGPYHITLPIGTIDYSLLGYTDNTVLWEQLGLLVGNGNGYQAGVTTRLLPYPASGSRIRCVAGDGGGTWVLWGSTWHNMAVAPAFYSFQFAVPVAGW